MVFAPFAYPITIFNWLHGISFLSNQPCSLCCSSDHTLPIFMSAQIAALEVGLAVRYSIVICDQGERGPAYKATYHSFRRARRVSCRRLHARQVGCSFARPGAHQNRFVWSTHDSRKRITKNISISRSSPVQTLSFRMAIHGNDIRRASRAPLTGPDRHIPVHVFTEFAEESKVCRKIRTGGVWDAMKLMQTFTLDSVGKSALGYNFDAIASWQQ
ncbi:hypothetical protein C8F01DRAFT_177895 [Mycena amicta]|nr:hypothetical protein C8F01DRAFT_177895 [Mycena amicta]